MEKTLDSKMSYNLIENAVLCWNDNSSFSLPIDSNEIYDISFGNDHICILDRLNALNCQDSEFNPTYTFESAHFDIEQVVSGAKHICKVISDLALSHTQDLDVSQQVFCTGDNTQGQLDVPARLKRTKDKIESIVAGPFSTCAKVEQKELVCWGNNSHQLQTGENHMAQGQHLWYGPGRVMLALGVGETYCAIKQGGGGNVDVDNGNMQYRNGVDNDLNGQSDHLPTHSSLHNAHNTLACWGQCAHGLCAVPEYLEQGSHHVSVGLDHACVLKVMDPRTFSDRTLAQCQGGANQQGQTEIPGVFTQHTRDIRAMNQQTCAIKDTAYVACWGISAHSNPHLTHFQRQISTGGRHSCALVGGLARCWGNNWQQQAEIPLISNQASNKGSLNIVFDYEFDKDVRSIQAGWDQTCGVNAHRNLFCWGLNVHGQTDVPNVVNEEVQRCLMKYKQPVDHEVRIVEVGLAHTCMVQQMVRCQESRGVGSHDGWSDQDSVSDNSELTDGGQRDANLVDQDIDQRRKDQISCWGGANDFNQNDMTNVMEYTLEHRMHFSKVSVGDEFTCLSLHNNRNSPQKHQTACIGDNSSGQLDIPAAISESVVQELSAGGAHTCIASILFLQQQAHPLSDPAQPPAPLPQLLTHCWGASSHGQAQVPDWVTRDKRVLSLSAGAAHSCAVVAHWDESDRQDGQLVCWGMSQGIEGLTQGQRQVRASWKGNAVLMRVRPLQVSAGFVHDCVVGTEGVGQCAGDDEEGQSSLPGIACESDSGEVELDNDGVYGGQNLVEAGMDTVQSNY